MSDWQRVGADNIEQLVLALLKEYPMLAEDDKLLLLAVWHKQGLSLTDEQKEAWFQQCATPESVTRVRRRLLEQRVVTQSKETAERRKQKAHAYKRRYGKKPF